MTTNKLIGHMVIWFPEADRANGSCPALVTGPEHDQPDGLLSLSIFREHATAVFPERNVRHIDDPVLETHPRMKRAGGWDFVESIPGGSNPAPIRVPKRKETATADAG